MFPLLLSLPLLGTLERPGLLLLSPFICADLLDQQLSMQREYLSQFKILFVYILSAVHRIKATSGCI